MRVLAVATVALWVIDLATRGVPTGVLPLASIVVSLALAAALLFG